MCLLSTYPVFLCNYIDFPMLGKYMHVIDLHVRTFLELGRPSKCQKKTQSIDAKAYLFCPTNSLTFPKTAECSAIRQNFASFTS